MGVNGTMTQATVFTAIVAKTNTSDVVQMEVVNGNEIEVRVNRVVLDFSSFSSQRYAEVEVTQQVNGTVTVAFTGGYFMEVGAENDILSLIKLTLPEGERGRAQGLLGNYNDNATDDFIPRNASASLPVESTLEEIHTQFGLSCEFEDLRHSEERQRVNRILYERDVGKVMTYSSSVYYLYRNRKNSVLILIIAQVYNPV